MRAFLLTLASTSSFRLKFACNLIISYILIILQLSNLVLSLTFISSICVPRTITLTFILLKLWPFLNLEFKVKVCMQAHNLYTTILQFRNFVYISASYP